MVGEPGQMKQTSSGAAEPYGEVLAAYVLWTVRTPRVRSAHRYVPSATTGISTVSSNSVP